MSTAALAQAAHPKQRHIAVQAKQGALALKNGKPKLAVESLTKALEQGNLKTFLKAAILNDRGVALGQLGEFQKAIADFNAALKIYPSYGAVYVNRGQLLSIQGFHSDAIKDYSRAIALLPDSGEPLVNRGIARLREGNTQSATIDFKHALAKEKNREIPFIGLAASQLRAGHVFLSLRYIQKALEIAPKHPLALYYRGVVEQRVKQYAYATDDFRRALNAEPNNEKLAMAYGLNLETRFWEKTAFGIYSQLLTRVPTHKAALLARCRVALSLKRFRSCQKDLDAYHDSYGKNADYLVLLAYLRVLENKVEEGREIAKTIVAANFSQDTSHLSLAGLMESLGEKAKAIQQYRSSLAYENCEPQARAHLKRLKAPLQLVIDKGKPSTLVEWNIVNKKGGGYFGRWAKLPKLIVPLETYGNAAPILSDFTLLGGAYKGFGLLRYHFNQRKPSGSFDFIVLIDVKRKEVRAIEPYLVNGKQADWSWKGDRVLVTDLDGITHKIVLQKRRVAPVNKESKPAFAKTHKKRKGNPTKKTLKSLFDLLGL